MDEDKNPPNKDKNRMIETYEEIVKRYGKDDPGNKPENVGCQ